MTYFQTMNQKQISKNELNLPKSNPGEILKNERILKKISLTKTASRLKTSKQQIQIIEAWDQDNMPSGIYLEGFIKRYAKFLSIDSASLIEQINTAQSSVDGAKNPTKTKAFKSKRYFVLSKATIIFIISMIVLLAFGYIAWQSAIFTAKPRLEVYSPKSGETVNTELTTVEGQVSQTSQVYINGVPVLVEPDGKFKDEVVLQKGSNNIEITAVNNISREAKVRRVVIFDPR